MVRVLIDDVILAIKITASMLSVQDLYDHLAKYATIPKCLYSKNYTFEITEHVYYVIEKQLLNGLHKSQFHTLTVDKSTAF
jgi:hypothetical protein